MGKFDSEESVFNFAVEYLKDISLSLKQCKQMAYIHNPDGWINSLRAVYRELSVKTNPEEDEDIEKDFKEVFSLLNSEEKYEQKQKIMYLLDRLEIKLRKKLQDKGMLLPSKADPRFAILER